MCDKQRSHATFAGDRIYCSLEVVSIGCDVEIITTIYAINHNNIYLYQMTGFGLEGRGSTN